MFVFVVTSSEMSADSDASGAVALLLSVGIKCMNNLNCRTENAGTVSVSFVVLLTKCNTSGVSLQQCSRH
jgi:hypothetical protein